MRILSYTGPSGDMPPGDQCLTLQTGNFYFGTSGYYSSGTDSSIPKSISEVINKLYQEMVLFDFNKRIQNLTSVVRQLDIAVRILENQKLEGKKLDQKRIARQQRLSKIAKKDQRLNAYLKSSNLLIPQINQNV